MKRAVLILIVLSAWSLAGCGRDPALRIGSKGFTEQEVLAELAAQLLRDRGLRVGPVVTSRDTFTAHRMLKIGQVDLMAEYSGTRWLFDMGPVQPETDDLLDAIRKRDARIGLSWQGPLGFDNGFCLLVTAERAEALGLKSIGDLPKLSGPVRVACPHEYLRRPLDGLNALAETYDFQVHENLMIDSSIARRVEALLNGRVDVAVGYFTDGMIDRMGLRILSDPKGFFPPYEAAFVVRAEVLERQPEVAEALGVLEGELTVEVIRELVYAVDVEGRFPSQVARDFLRRRDLITTRTEELRRRPQIVIAVAEGDDFGPLIEQARLGVREAFPGRVVRVDAVERPDREVNQGEARLALLGAERFFRAEEGDRPPRRLESLQAAAVVGKQMVHLVRRAGEPVPDNPFSGRVGVPPARSGGAIVARGLLEGQEAERWGQPDELIDSVAAGELDAAIVLVVLGESRVAEALARHRRRVQLVPLSEWLDLERSSRLPFLRSARIEAGTYGLDEPLLTLGAQVVLAGAAVEQRELAAGPGAALPVGGIPLTQSEVEALADAVPDPVAPDPALPSAWGLTTPVTTPSLLESVWLTGMNLATLAFLVWLVAQIRRPSPAASSSSDPPSP